VRAEHYRQARVPIVVVSSHLDLDPGERLFQPREGSVPPIIATHRGSPPERRAALQEAGAEIVDCGDATLDPRMLVSALEERGLLRILCEGGPTLFATLLADGLVDELCLTIHPKFVGPDHRRIVRGTAWAEPRSVNLRHAIEDGGELLLRYGL
jgi:riboflavin biosynthesis pyrimidine reductase